MRFNWSMLYSAVSPPLWCRRRRQGWSWNAKLKRSSSLPVRPFSSLGTSILHHIPPQLLAFHLTMAVGRQIIITMRVPRMTGALLTTVNPSICWTPRRVDVRTIYYISLTREAGRKAIVEYSFGAESVSAMGNSASKERAAFHDKYNALDQSYHAAVEKSSTQETELVAARTELESSRRESRKESDGLRLQLSELERKFDALQQDRVKQTEALKGELSRELQGQLRVAEALTMERNRARKEAEKFKEQVHELSASSQDGAAKLQEESRDLKAQIERQRAVFQESLDEKEKTINEKEDARLALEVRAKQHEDRALSSGEELAAMKRNTAQQEQEHATLGEQLAIVQSKLAESEARALRSEQQSADLSTNLKQSQADLAEKEQRLSMLNEQLATVQARLDASEQTLGSLREGSHSASDELQAAKHTALTQAEKHTALATQLLSVQASLKTSEESNTDLSTSLSASKASLETEVQRSAQLAAQLATAQKSHSTTQAALANLQSTYNGSISKRNGLHEAFEAVKIELREYHQSYKAQQSQLEAVQQQLAASEAARKELAGDGQGLRSEVPAQVRVGA
nr:hypothetical protein CFP56_37224 [Quercus suber]